MARRKLQPEDIKAGFDKNPQNINRTGANRKPISAILKQLLDEKIVSFELTLTDANGNQKTKKTELKSKAAFKEVIAISLLQKAMSGDLKAMDMVLDRTEGKAKETIEQNINMTEIPPLKWFSNETD
jgi:hypothetical protein